MSEPTEPLHVLAEAVGLQRQWRDVDGREHIVPDERLARILAALGFKSDTPRQISSHLRQLERELQALPALVVADAGEPIALPFPCRTATLAGPDGADETLELRDGVPLAPSEPGYYRCAFDGQATQLAVAPGECPLPPQGDTRPWGISLQISSLRSAGAKPYGDLGSLAEAIDALAHAGVDAIAINPVHALFAGDGGTFSPYSPSSRRFLNGALADPALAGLPPLEGEAGEDLIDWQQALPARLNQLRTLFDSLGEAQRAGIVGQVDDALRQQAVFDALDCHFRSQGLRGWREWPTRYRKPGNKSVAEFARKNAEEVDFHLFVQSLTAKCLAATQDRARALGMSIGLVGDLAVGVDPGGSDCWALGDAMLQGLTIGAPPDPLGPHGQNWSITGFSPQGLKRTGYAPWIAMIRAAMAHGGGLRIDHAFGLARLWVIPEGGAPGDGAYLTYPFADLIRLLALEAHLADCFVIAEDLGTAPHGFTQEIARHQMLGMRVLWFQRAEDHGFIGAQDYDPLAVAMTGTHDTPTLAGWWTGRDLDWADRLDRLPADIDCEKAGDIRDWDRGLMWSTIAGHAPRPAPDDPAPAVTAAIGHIARTPCALAIVPVEDLLGLVEQPNLPGTVLEHPNWRRRLSAPMSELLAAGDVAERLGLLNAGP